MTAPRKLLWSQFSLLALFILVTLVGLGLAWIVSWRHERYEERTTTAITSTHIWAIQYGFSDKNLIFVLFRGEDQKLGVSGGGVMGPNGNGSFGGGFVRPDGTWVTMPNRTQLYEIVDGKYKECDRRVTFAQLQNFLASNPDAYTIDRLLQFVDAQPK